MASLTQTNAAEAIKAETRANTRKRKRKEDELNILMTAAGAPAEVQSDQGEGTEALYLLERIAAIGRHHPILRQMRPAGANHQPAAGAPDFDAPKILSAKWQAVRWPLDMTLREGESVEHMSSL